MLKWMLTVLTAVSCWVGYVLPAGAQAAPAPDPIENERLLKKVYRCDLDKPVCVITDHQGGLVWDAWKASRAVLAHQIIVVIDGECQSACVLFAEWARWNVRVTERAVFVFHQGLNPETGKHQPNTHSDEVQKWVDQNGGERITNDPKKSLRMAWPDTANFWKPVKLHDKQIVSP